MGELDKSISKYFDGQTSREEEAELFDAMKEINSSDFDAELAMDRLAHKHRELSLSEDFDNRLMELIEEPKTRSLWNHWGVISGIAASLALLVMVAIWGDGMESAKTGNQSQVIALSDGSTVTLNAHSELIYPSTFEGDTRDVELIGEAFFEIEKDPEHPFVIKSGKSLTTVLGTSFNLRNYPMEESIELSVFTGKVKFADDNEEVMVVANEFVEMDKETIDIGEKEAKSVNAASWKSKALFFDQTNLGLVLRDLERHYRIQFEVADPTLLDCHFRGTFTDASVSDILRTFEYSLNISYDTKGDVYILSGTGCED